ncbi:MAG: efflux transporter outer membrane subunit [Alphaproteobacteria bacterium]|nr:efflux transporter outer membrane subunit [Alphaproteobacteria bacterium]
MLELRENNGKTGIFPSYGRLTAAAVIALALAGCAVVPDYAGAPDMALQKFHNVDSVAAGQQNGDTVSLDKWWAGFNDPELTKIVEKAIDQNLDLAASIARVQEARAAAQSAGARLLPTADASADATHIRSSLESPIGAIGSHLPGYDRDNDFYNIGAGASWEIDLFGGLRRGEEEAEAEAQAAEAEHLGVRVSVAAEAADSYIQIRGFQAQLAAVQKQVDVDKQRYGLIQLRQKYGAADDRDAAEAEALLRSAEAEVPQLRIALEAQLNRLDVLLGVQPGTYAAELAKPARIPSIPSVTTTVSASDLLRRRPDLIVAERRLAASNAAIGVAVSDYYPKISLSGLLGFESMDVQHLFRAATFQPQAIGGLRWRLFDFGKVDAEVAAAKGAHAEALAQYRQSVLRATEDVEDSFMALAQYKVQADAVTQKEKTLSHSKDLAQAEYEHGALSLPEVLDAEREVLSAQNELAQAKTSAARAAVASFRALGGGW